MFFFLTGASLAEVVELIQKYDHWSKVVEEDPSKESETLDGFRKAI